MHENEYTLVMKHILVHVRMVLHGDLFWDGSNLQLKNSLLISSVLVFIYMFFALTMSLESDLAI